MAPSGKPRESGERIVRTSLELPESLWLRAKQRALEERTDLRTLIMRGLESVLARPKGKPKHGR